MRPYDITIKNVVIAGASGQIGRAILDELLKSGLFTITVLTRSPNIHTFPDSVAIVPVDYTSQASLTSALTGQDALISTLSPSATALQTHLISACLATKVKRFLPSEYAHDLYNPTIRSNPLFSSSVAIEENLKALQAPALKPTLSYTFLFCGPILELSLRNGVFFSLPSHTAKLWHGGNDVFSTTRLASVGKAVRRILTHPRETADRAIWIKDLDVSQREVVEMVMRVRGEEDWELTEVGEQDEVEEAGDEGKRVDVRFATMFQKVHNGVFGIREMTKGELEEMIIGMFTEGTG